MDTNEMYQRRDIEKLLKRDVKQLYKLIAQADPNYKGMQFAPDQAIKMGQKSLAKLKDGIYEKICIEWDYCNQARNADVMTLIVTISNLILQSVSGIPANIIAVLLFKIGLDQFCECTE